MSGSLFALRIPKLGVGDAGTDPPSLRPLLIGAPPPVSCNLLCLKSSYDEVLPRTPTGGSSTGLGIK